MHFTNPKTTHVCGTNTIQGIKKAIAANNRGMLTTFLSKIFNQTLP